MSAGITFMQRVTIENDDVKVRFAKPTQLEAQFTLAEELRRARRVFNRPHVLRLVISDVDDFKLHWTKECVQVAWHFEFLVMHVDWRTSDVALSGLTGAELPSNIEVVVLSGQVSALRPLFLPTARLEGSCAAHSLTLNIEAEDESEAATATDGSINLYDQCGSILSTCKPTGLTLGSKSVYSTHFVIDDRCFRADAACVRWVSRLTIRGDKIDARETLLEHFSNLLEISLSGTFPERLLYHLSASYDSLRIIDASETTCLMPPAVQLAKMEWLHRIAAEQNPLGGSSRGVKPLEARHISNFDPRRSSFVEALSRGFAVDRTTKEAQLLSTVTLAPKFATVLNHIGITSNALVAQALKVAFEVELSRCSELDLARLVTYMTDRTGATPAPLDLFPTRSSHIEELRKLRERARLD